MEQAPSSPRLKFGPYLVDLAAGEVLKNGSRIRLQEKPLRVLALLAERQGQLVTREDLKNHLWPEDTFVDFENGLNTAVSRLRDALQTTPTIPDTSKPSRAAATGLFPKLNLSTDTSQPQTIPPMAKSRCPCSRRYRLQRRSRESRRVRWLEPGPRFELRSGFRLQPPSLSLEVARIG